MKKLWVSFKGLRKLYENKELIVGNAVLQYDKKLDCVEDFEVIYNKLKEEYKLDNVTILNWRRLEA